MAEDLPTRVTIRTYNVGFGDCFLMSIAYAQSRERHVLIDFGSTGLPEKAEKSRLHEIAKNIGERCDGRLDAIVATHRHRDHISGFATAEKEAGSGDLIAALKPRLVVQPWTEDPDLAVDAEGPIAGDKRAPEKRFTRSLANMQEVAGEILNLARTDRSLKELKDQLSFLGADNIANLSAVENLMGIAPNRYVHCGSRSGLEKLLPGTTVHVLGPPTLRQTMSIKKQRHEDPEQFWLNQLRALRSAERKAGRIPPLFPSQTAARGPRFPIDTRWLIHRAKRSRGQQLLQIVRILDKAMNNTSVILLFEVGDQSILFPGDAQIENWEYALSDSAIVERLRRVNVYKVGHHGSRNATPKSLWDIFERKAAKGERTDRLVSLMSTMPGKHGHETSNTEVPRRTLVQELQRRSDHHSTHELPGESLYFDIHIEVSSSPKRGRAAPTEKRSARKGS